METSKRAWKGFCSIIPKSHMTWLSAAQPSTSPKHPWTKGSHRPGCPWALTLSEPAQRTHPGPATACYSLAVFAMAIENPGFPIGRCVCPKKQDIGTPKFDGESLVCLVKRPLWGANPSNKSKYDPNSRCPMNLQCQVQIPKFEHSNLQVGGRRSQKDVKKKDCVGLYYHTYPISRVPAFVVPCVSNLIRGPDIL